MKLICYSKCSTCKRAQKWLEENGLEFESRDIKLDNPKEDELRGWHAASGLPIKRFFNTSGMKYRELGLAKRLDSMSDDEKYSLLATDGMLVKRPILLFENKVLIGFKESEWAETLL